MTLAIWVLASAIIFHGVIIMTRAEFLTSIANSISGLSTSMTAIATAIQNHPSTGDADFDPDGTLANAASQLSSLAKQASDAANALNPATPGGINDAGNGGTGQPVTDPTDAKALGGKTPADPGAGQGGNDLGGGAGSDTVKAPGEQAGGDQGGDQSGGNAQQADNGNVTDQSAGAQGGDGGEPEEDPAGNQDA